MTGNNFNILIVDDIIENIKLVMSILESEPYHLYYALNGKQALDMINAEPTKFDFILMDVMIPELDGFGACQQLKSNPATKNIPLMFITAKADGESIATGFQVGGIDYITKPLHAAELLVKIKNHVGLHQAKQLLKQHNISLEQKISVKENEFFSELTKTQHELIHTLTDLIDVSLKSSSHKRFTMTKFMVQLARLHPNLTQEEVLILHYATPLYDIGKLTLPEPIKHKHDHLTPEERDVLQTYPENGFNILKRATNHISKTAAIIARQHKEKWDGSGFPNNLAQHDIHIYARMLAVVETLYDLTRLPNGGSRGTSMEEVLTHITRLAGIKFDPEIVRLVYDNQEAFIELL